MILCFFCHSPFASLTHTCRKCQVCCGPASLCSRGELKACPSAVRGPPWGLCLPRAASWACGDLQQRNRMPSTSPRVGCPCPFHSQDLKLIFPIGYTSHLLCHHSPNVRSSTGQRGSDCEELRPSNDSLVTLVTHTHSASRQ